MKEKQLKVLNISYYMTCPPTSGGALRIVTPYIHMNDDSSISVDFLFSTWDDMHTRKCAEYLMKFSTVNSVTGVIAKQYLRKEDGCPEEIPTEVWVTLSSELKEKAVEMVQNTNYDIIQIEHSLLAWIVPYLKAANPESKIVLDLHNLEHLIYKRWMPYALSDTKNSIENSYNTILNWEKEVLNWFDGIFTVSPIESKMVKEISTVENIFDVATGGGIDCEKYKPKERIQSKKYDLLYIGTMEWYPNAHGLIWFIKKVLPLVTNEFPNIKLNIVGFGEPIDELVKISKNHPNIKFWGEQKDDIKFFHNSRIFIVPLWIGAGARVKIPTAWAAQIPIVSTNLGAEGLDAVNGHNIMLADQPEEFAGAIKKILNDNIFAETLINNGIETVNRKYSIQKCVEQIVKGYEVILNKSDNELENFVECKSDDEKVHNMRKYKNAIQKYKFNINDLHIEINDFDLKSNEDYVKKHMLNWNGANNSLISRLLGLYWSAHPKFIFYKFSKRSAKFLDIGAGPGGLSTWRNWMNPSREDIQLYGLDLFESPYKCNYVDFKVCDVCQDTLPYESEFFDCIFLSHVFEHFSDTAHAIKAMQRCLKVKGQIYIEVPAKISYTLPNVMEFRNAGINVTDGTTNFYENSTHIQTYDTDEIFKMFCAEGNYKLVNSGNIRNPLMEDILIKYGIENMESEATTYGVWSKLGWANFVILEKI
ncbi:MAG: glycosyltransferase [Clostridiales bacterium]|jgi:glycosyltransferase involved in cell wall biosynthesis/SAM-dependent methyltransferase|nr:glycosyltransferase [Clostridiales bacterium]